MAIIRRNGKTTTANTTTNTYNKGENTMKNTMIKRNTTNNAVKGEEVMKNQVTGKVEMDMEQLKAMVANLIDQHVSNIGATTETEKSVDGGQWAKNSKYYGQMICGAMYNPYTNRRWIPSKFLAMMKKFDRNVDEGIRCEYPYYEGIKYMIKEVNTLAMLEKKDPLAFSERKLFWSVGYMNVIFIDYIDNVIEYIESKAASRLKKESTDSTWLHISGHSFRTKIIRTVEDNKLKETVKVDELDEFRILRNNLEKAYKYADIAKIVNAMKMIKLPGNRMCYWVSGGYKYRHCNGYEHHKAFVEGFKKAGAYYTLKDLIEFENAEFKGRKGREAVDYLRLQLKNGEPAYVIYAMLKECMEQNGFSID